MRRILVTRNDAVLTVLRLMLGLVFFAHGAQKMLGWFGGAGFVATMGFFAPRFGPFFAFLAICAEFFGSLGLLVGLLARVAAFGIICNMVVAVLTVHLPNGLFMNWTGQQKGEGFEFHLLVLAMAIVILVWGAGAISIDRALTRSRERV